MPAKLNLPRILTLMTIVATIIVFFIVRAQNASFSNLALTCLERTSSASQQLAACTKALEHPELIKPLERRILINRSYLNIKDRNYEDANEDLERAYEIYPHDPSVIKRLAVVSFYLGRYERAEQLFRTVLEHDPDDHKILEILVDMILHFDEPNISIQKLTELSTSYPDSAFVASKIGKLLQKNNQYSLAAQHDVAALEIDPKNVAAFNQLQDICLETPTHCIELKGDYDTFPDCNKALEEYNSRVPNFKDLLTELVGEASEVVVNTYTPESWGIFSISLIGTTIQLRTDPQPQAAQIIGLLIDLLECNDSAFVESQSFQPETYATFQKTFSAPIKHNFRVFAHGFQ